MPGPRKAFFSEENNQKTLRVLSRPARGHPDLNLQKSFASFLQKRRPSFPASPAPAGTLPAIRAIMPRLRYPRLIPEKKADDSLHS
jgi:hypothetical protein